jgi:hypothetical protein
MGDFSISGGNYGPINTGSGSQDNRGMTIGSAESADALARLERLLDEHAPRLEEGDEAREDLADVREQAGKDKPDKPVRTRRGGRRAGHRGERGRRQARRAPALTASYNSPHA